MTSTFALYSGVAYCCVETILNERFRVARSIDKTEKYNNKIEEEINATFSLGRLDHSESFVASLDIIVEY